jgi:signal transduction histidine kinase
MPRAATHDRHTVGHSAPTARKWSRIVRKEPAKNQARFPQTLELALECAISPGGTPVAGDEAGPDVPTSLVVSKLPLRLRFSLAVAAIVTGVIGALWWFSLRMNGSQTGATLWFALSGILLVTLLVDQAARRLIYRRLAQMRETMRLAAAGQLTARVSIGAVDEIGVIARGLNDILHGLERLSEAVDVRVEAAHEAFRQKSVKIADSHREMAMLSEELARAGRLAALGQAAANMAHQIGTPLNLISGYVQLLIESSPAPSPSVDRLKAVQDQIAKVTAIVRAALDSSRPPALPHEPADLVALVRRVCQMAGPMLDDAKVQVEVVAPPHPLHVMADPVQLELALLNLITNSVDAMTSGGTLTVRLGSSDHRIRVDVEDTGSGVSAELLARIFDPWVTTKAPGKGSGLGLSIARQVIVGHGGSIRVANRPGGGAVFTIDLPAAVGSRRPEPIHAENSRR